MRYLLVLSEEQISGLRVLVDSYGNELAAPLHLRRVYTTQELLDSVNDPIIPCYEETTSGDFMKVVE